MKYKGKTISKRPNGTWWVRYFHNGKQYSIYAKTQSECLKKLKQALKNIENEQNNIYTLEQWIYKWQELYKINKVKESTLHSMNLLLKKYIFSNKIATMQLNKLNGIILQEFINSIEQPRQREHIYIHLKDILNKALINGLIKNNPILLVNLPKYEKQQRRALTRKEQTIFIEECKKNKYGIFFEILLYSGMRRGELLALEVSDINFNDGYISINKTFNDLGQITTTKNGKGRKIPIFEPLKQPLEMAIKDTEDKRLYNITENPINTNFSKIRKNTNIQNVTIHSLRHTFATNCLEANIPIKQVSEWLGHSSIEITLNTYTHINTKFELENKRKLDNYLT